MLHMLQAVWENSDRIAACATAIGLILAVVLLFSTRRQVKGALGAAAVRVFELIHTDLNSRESRRNRRIIYSCGLRGKQIYANEFVRARADSVCVSLDRVGVMLRNELVPKGPARTMYFDMYVDVFIRSWEILKEYIQFVRTKKTRQHYRNFEYLADMAKLYWAKEFPQESVDIPQKRERRRLADGVNPYSVLSSREVCDKPETWFRVRVDRVRLAVEEGAVPKEFDYTVAEIGPSVGVVALDGEGRIRLVGQWRYTFGRYSWEIPTGIVDGTDEDELAAAKRELLEETGLSAAAWVKLGSIDNSNGSTHDVGHLFLAAELTESRAQPDATEIIQMDWVDFWEAIELVHENAITESLSVAAILKAARYLTMNEGMG